MTTRALLVDDDPDTRALLALALNSDGRFTVQAMSRFDAASELHRDATGYDALLVHLGQSEGDGAKLVAAIRQWAPVLPIVTLGAAGTIAKPIDPLALPDQIADLLAPSASPAQQSAPSLRPAGSSGAAAGRGPPLHIPRSAP